LVDILIGGIAYRLNGHDKALNAAPAKDELSSYILKCAGVSDPFKDTAHAADFTIWHRQWLRATRESKFSDSRISWESPESSIFSRVPEATEAATDATAATAA